MSTRQRLIVLFISALMLISMLTAEEMFDSKMKEIAGKYLQIQEMLAADKTDDVTGNAAGIAELAKGLDVSKVAEEHKMHFANLPENIGVNVQKLSDAKDIKAMRAAFTELSKPMAMWVSMMLPMGIKVAYCSMTPGSWLQRGEEIMNPYYGASMLHCGEIVSKGAEMIEKNEMMPGCGAEMEMKASEEGPDCRKCPGQQ